MSNGEIIFVGLPSPQGTQAPQVVTTSRKPVGFTRKNLMNKDFCVNGHDVRDKANALRYRGKSDRGTDVYVCRQCQVNSARAIRNSPTPPNAPIRKYPAKRKASMVYTPPTEVSAEVVSAPPPKYTPHRKRYSPYLAFVEKAVALAQTRPNEWMRISEPIMFNSYARYVKKYAPNLDFTTRQAVGAKQGFVTLYLRWNEII